MDLYVFFIEHVLESTFRRIRGGALLGATLLGASTIFAQENESNKFDTWAKEIEGRDDLIEEVDV